ncbi:MAG: hypothetical protein KF726_21615, partial [Anaerolineae bacterium]|nr:hypothetical protein [Anaerolineae bacterium]
VLYASPVSDQVAANGEYWVNLNTIPPFGDAQPTTLGKISFGVGCGGGSPLPADWQYWQETGFGGNYLTLQWTSFGILHSLSCNGAGAALLDPQTGMDRILAPLSDSQSQPEVHLSRLKVSPDGTLIGAIKTSYQGANVQTGVALIDLATGALTDVSTTQMPEQLGWLGSDTLYYSTRVPRSDLIAALAPEQKQAFDSAIGGNGMSVGSWDLFIRQIKLVNRASAADQVVYSADGYQIGRFGAASDGALWFSQIPNLNSWLAEIVSGELDLTQATQADQLETVPVSIFMLQSDGTSPVSLIAEGLNQFVIQPTP